MKAPQSFEFHIQDGIGHIVLSRPEVYNALTFRVYAEMTQLFADLQDMTEVRVVVISGRGKAFCTGGDVKEIIGPLLGQPEHKLLAFTRMTCDLVWNIRNLNKPVIACLNGVTAGAGAMIALASDFRIAAESARIAFLFVRVGLSGADMGACYLLPKVIGLTKATELLMTGDFITAQEALALGLYNRVTTAEELSDATMEMARKLAAGPAYGIGITKAQLNQETLPRLREALDEEARVQAHCMLHPDYTEGFAAFTEKRPPQFK